LALFGFLFASACALALYDWRRGLVACIAIGFLQDPARKLAPDRPVYFVVAVAVVFACCLLGAFVRRERVGLRSVTRWFPRIQAPAVVFVLVVAAGGVMTLLRTGRPTLAGIGLLAYLSPPLAMLLGQRYCSDPDQLRRWLRYYVLAAAVMAGTVFLQFAGVESKLFESIGVEIVFGTGGMIEMMGGIMRSSEIAAWHAGAAACLGLALTLSARSLRGRWIGAILFAAFLGSVILSGRRKMVAAIVLFVLVYLVLLARHAGSASRLMQSLAGAGALAIVGAQWLGSATTEYGGDYLGRSASIVQEGADRLIQMTVFQLGNILRRNGIWGAGAGTGAQGAQYFGGGTSLVGGAAEGGLGKVLAELGLPGLIVLLWLGFELGRAMLRVARLTRQLPRDLAYLLLGVMAFLPANAAVFLTAHQVFGDPFVLIVLGWLSGAALAAPPLIVARAREGAATAPRPPRHRVAWRSARA